MQERTLTYELRVLEGIISDELLRSDHKAAEDLLAHQDGVKNLLLDEVNRIKKKFVHEIFSFEDERHLERYIQFHQQELIRIADSIIGQERVLVVKDTSATQEKSLIISYGHSCLEELLQFIEKHFTKYFDQDTKAPESYITRVGSELIKWFGECQDQLRQRGTDPMLIDLALHPLKKFIEQIPGGPITYRKIIYVKEIQKDLNQILKSVDTSVNVNEEVRNNLLYLNYNTLKYFKFYTSYIISLIQEIDSPAGRIEKLSLVSKLVNQTQVKPGISYNRTVRSLKDQIADWLSEEIFYLERMHQLNEKNAVGNPVDESFRLKTELSVSQLAYLVRIFLETQIIQNKNVSEVMRFFARFFQSKRLERISYEGFRVRFYNTEDGTRRSVRALLLSLVDHINKE